MKTENIAENLFWIALSCFFVLCVTVFAVAAVSLVVVAVKSAL